MEDYFTFTEISSLLHDAGDPKYLEKNLWHPGFLKCDIQKIPQKGLILVTGNDDTGYLHIMKRHNPVRRDTFKEYNNELDSPTTFEYTFVPIIHILAIADEIFCSQNKKKIDPSRPLFECYEGNSDILSTQNNFYRLICYRETKIIHTLYPLRSSTKRKYTLNLKQGGISVSENLSNLKLTVKIPYFNKLDLLSVRLEIIHDNHKKETYGSYILFDHHGEEVAKYKLVFLPWISLKFIDVQSYYRYTFDFRQTGIHKQIRQSLKDHGLL